MSQQRPASPLCAQRIQGGGVVSERDTCEGRTAGAVERKLTTEGGIKGTYGIAAAAMDSGVDSGFRSCMASAKTVLSTRTTSPG